LNKTSNNKEDNFVTIKFHVYVPPDFELDGENFEFVINSSLNNWNEKKTIKLNHRFLDIKFHSYHSKLNILILN
jgi:hypothetical protein